MPDSSGGSGGGATEVGALYYTLGISDADFAASLTKAGAALKASLVEANSAVEAARTKTIDAAAEVTAAEERLAYMREMGIASAQSLAKAEEAVAVAQANSEKATLALMQAQEAAITSAQGLAAAQAEVGAASTAGIESSTAAVGGLNGGLAKTAATFGMVMGVGKAFSDNLHFDAAIQQMLSNVPQASEQMKEKLKQDVIDISTQYGLSGTAAAQGFTMAIKSGLKNPEEIKSFMATVAKASIAGEADPATTEKVIAGAYLDYKDQGMTPEKAANAMYAASHLGKTTFGEMVGPLSGVLPISSAAGIPLEQITAAMATMTRESVPTGQAATNLTTSIRELSNENLKAGKTFKEITGSALPEYIAQGHTLGQAYQVMTDYAKEHNVAVSTLFSRYTAGAAAVELAGAHQKQYADDLKYTTETTTALNQSFDIASQSIQYKMNKAMAEFSVGLRSAGQGITPFVLDLAHIAEGVGSVMGAFPTATTTIIEIVTAMTLMNKVMKMESVQSLIGSLRGVQTGLTNEAATAEQATLANRELAAARREAAAAAEANTVATETETLATETEGGAGLMSRLGGAGAGLIGKAGPAIALVGAMSAVQGMTSKDQVDYYRDQYSGPSWAEGLTSETASGIASVLHTLTFGATDGFTEYDKASNYNAQLQQDQQKQAADQKVADLKKQAQQTIDDAAGSVTGLNAAQQNLADALAQGDANAIDTADQMTKQVQQSIDQMTAQLTSASDWSQMAKDRYTTVNKDTAAAAESALSDAQYTQQKAQQKVDELRKAAGHQVLSDTAQQVIDDAEHTLADAKAKTDAAKKAADKASHPQDQSQAPADVLKQMDSQVNAALTQAFDVNKMSAAGLKPEAIQKLMDIDKNHPGTLDRFVHEDLTQPVIDKINKGLGELDGANNVIAQAINKQLNQAAQAASDPAYQAGFKTGQTFAMGFHEGLNVNPNDPNGRPLVVGSDGIARPFVGPTMADNKAAVAANQKAAAAAPQATWSPGQVGPGMPGMHGGFVNGVYVQNMTVTSNTPQDWANQANNFLARTNLAGG